SILVYAEVTEYIQGFPNAPQRQHELRLLLREIYPYFLTYSIVERYADLRRKLRPPYCRTKIKSFPKRTPFTLKYMSFILIRVVPKTLVGVLERVLRAK